MTQALERNAPLVARLPGLALFTLVVAVSGWWSIHMALGPSGFSMLWIPSGILFGVLMTSPRGHWPAYLACALLAFLASNLQRNGAGLLTLALSLCNLFDAWFAARLVASRVGDVGQLASINRTLRVGGIATLLACTLSALAAATARQALMPQQHGFGVLFETWLASHALGMVIFGALTVITRIEGHRMLGPPKRRLELLATVALVAASAWLIFMQASLSITFLLLPPLMFCVLRHRFSGFVPAIALIAVIAATATAAGHGPFVLGAGATDEVARARMLQLFILCCCWAAFPVASVLTERRILTHRVARSEQQYRMLADYSRDLIIRIGPGRTLEYISPSVTELLGWTREEYDRLRWELVHPDDVAILRDTMDPLYEKGGMASIVYRCRHKQGSYIWLAANVRSVTDANGRAALVYSGRDVTSRVEAELALEQQVRRDPLTGLANRLLFDERMALALARGGRNRTRVGLLYIDLDYFKSVNDNHGHAVGDLVLREFARRLSGCIRSVDLGVRLGGDEFAVLVEDIATTQSLQFVANKLATAMREPMTLGELTLHVTASIGVGMSGCGQTDAAALVQLADGALYQAKAAGRDTWRLAVAEGPNDCDGNA
ncbi:sensor domain-containing diguanylate cyclase [Thermomonas sp. XSG]|uniref:sensor domain-containing diguanylate cyclase n=1 Tax=Thermomonas sp. XSG TaxID=2771436 RepID=UPI00167FFCA3|nr:sensor domain-containing diguanylate cyclase [Thermomonas sp. XSG]QNU15619.1 diguanylate cyclase [Thermomonas sp. XSG]